LCRADTSSNGGAGGLVGVVIWLAPFM
jgi:hypothetical protein